MSETGCAVGSARSCGFRPRGVCKQAKITCWWAGAPHSTFRSSDCARTFSPHWPGSIGDGARRRKRQRLRRRKQLNCPPARARDERIQEYDFGYRPVGGRPSSLAVFFRYAADGKAAPGGAAATSPADTADDPAIAVATGLRATDANATNPGGWRSPCAGRPARLRAEPAPAPSGTRPAVLAAGERVAIDTPDIKGSVALRGARIDDVALTRFHETVDPKSPAIVLLSPSGTPHPFYAEFGWVGGAGQQLKLPGPDTVWRQEGAGSLTPGKPITLIYDNGENLVFSRTISVDDKYLFTVQDQVVNKGTAPVTLYPYALVSRHGTPQTLGYYILHEGLIGVLGDQGLQEVTYKTIDDKKVMNFNVTNAWLGITDKYWAATLLPDPKAHVQARFSTGSAGTIKSYQADYLLDGVTVAPGSSASASGRLSAGAKEVSVVDNYDKKLNLNRFELLIDWGWFYFITKPMFMVIDFFFRWTHNFGVAILIVTVLVKILFFPLANKSYASMAKMKSAQPQMVAIRERWPDDKVRQQQELMELYKREKIPRSPHGPN